MSWHCCSFLIVFLSEHKLIQWFVLHAMLDMLFMVLPPTFPHCLHDIFSSLPTFVNESDLPILNYRIFSFSDSLLALAQEGRGGSFLKPVVFLSIMNLAAGQQTTLMQVFVEHR